MVQKVSTKNREEGVLENPMPVLPSHTYKTSSGYQFRVVVPKPLRGLIGKREIKKNLGCDYRVACSKAYLLSLEADKLFQSARHKLCADNSSQQSLSEFLSSPPEKRLKPISEVSDELVESIKQLWLSTLDADLARRREGLEDDEYEELEHNINFMKAKIGLAIAKGDVSAFTPAIRTLLHGRGYDLKLPPEEERLLVLDVLPALQHGYDILGLRQQGRQVHPDCDSAKALPAVWQESPQQNTGLTWEKLFDHWKSDRNRPEKTVSDAESYLQSIKKLFPKSTPETFTRAMAAEWLRQVRDLSNNKAKTLEKKGNLVGAMFSIAVADEILEKNPFAGFDYKRFAAKVGIEEDEQRLPFSLDQLKRIFSDSEGIVSLAYKKPKGGGGYYPRVWLPLIALLSGARLDEIGSLTVDDVIESPVPHFCVRKGKTKNSVREVPLHPELIRLGFLQYVDDMRSAGYKSLWPFMKSGSDKRNNSEVFGKWFNLYLRGKLKFSSEYVFHSFRHTFKDLCRDALIPREIHHAISGHDKNDQSNVGDSYGLGYSVLTKYQEIKKIKLGFDLVPPDPYHGAGKVNRMVRKSAPLA